MEFTAERVHGIVLKQREYFRAGETLDVGWRIAQLKKLLRAVKDHQETLQAALNEDLGRSAAEAYLCDIGPVIVEISGGGRAPKSIFPG